jgi:hypothetical protein
MLGISVSVKDDEDCAFTTIAEAKSYAPDLFDKVVKRETRYPLLVK